MHIAPWANISIRTRSPDGPQMSFFIYLARDARYLFERQLARQHHDVGPLREELHRLGVRYVALGGYMHLHAYAPGIEHGGHVGGYYGIDPSRRAQSMMLCIVASSSS